MSPSTTESLVPELESLRKQIEDIVGIRIDTVSQLGNMGPLCQYVCCFIFSFVHEQWQDIGSF